MIEKRYVPEQGHILKKNRLYHNNFPLRIEIIKVTRSGHVHFKDLTRSGHHQQSTSLHTLRKCFVLDNVDP